jgi:hypothetical protein
LADTRLSFVVGWLLCASFMDTVALAVTVAWIVVQGLNRAPEGRKKHAAHP